jgi:transcription initiation factor IIE alpha subunit
VLWSRYIHLTQKVASTLLSRGRCSFPQIVQKTHLSQKSVRELLFVLVQNNLVTYADVEEGARIVVYYEISVEQILLRDRFPVYVLLTKLKLNEDVWIL